MLCTSPSATYIHAGAREGSGYTHCIVKVATAFVVEPMRVEHIPAVSAIEKLSFPQPWPQNAYRREIVENRMAHYIVARRLGDSSDESAIADTARELRMRLERLFSGPPDQRAVNVRVILDSLPGVAAPIDAVGGAPQ